MGISNYSGFLLIFNCIGIRLSPPQEYINKPVLVTLTTLCDYNCYVRNDLLVTAPNAKPKLSSSNFGID